MSYITDPKKTPLTATVLGYGGNLNDREKNIVSLCEGLETERNELLRETTVIAYKKLEVELAETRLRLSEGESRTEEAEAWAFQYVCGILDSGAELPNKEGWMRNGEEDEETFAYAAARGLIERHPKQPLYFKFTKLGKEWK